MLKRSIQTACNSSPPNSGKVLQTPTDHPEVGRNSSQSSEKTPVCISCSQQSVEVSVGKVQGKQGSSRSRPKKNGAQSNRALKAVYKDRQQSSPRTTIGLSGCATGFAADSATPTGTYDQPVKVAAAVTKGENLATTTLALPVLVQFINYSSFQYQTLQSDYYNLI